MADPGRYRQRAEDCIELAKTVRDQNERRILLTIAEQYRRLANPQRKAAAIPRAAASRKELTGRLSRDVPYSLHAPAALLPVPKTPKGTPDQGRDGANHDW